MKKITNKEFTNDMFFIECCNEAGIKPTDRQASKFRRGMGIAYKFSPTVSRKRGGSK